MLGGEDGEAEKWGALQPRDASVTLVEATEEGSVAALQCEGRSSRTPRESLSHVSKGGVPFMPGMSLLHMPATLGQ